MKFGINLPPFADFASPLAIADLAAEAERAGWDGFFLWDHMIFSPAFFPIADPWVALAAAAMRTQQIRLGTMLTPLARRRPWKLARETVSLDQLSAGRFTLGVGLGDPAQWEYGFFKEETDARLRAEKLDEGLAVLTGLWSGEPFSFQGKHYQIRDACCEPKPDPLPVIMVGAFKPKMLRLTARYADWWNVSSTGVEIYRRMVGEFEQACAAVGRDPATVRRSWESKSWRQPTPTLAWGCAECRQDRKNAL